MFSCDFAPNPLTEAILPSCAACCNSGNVLMPSSLLSWRTRLALRRRALRVYGL